MGNQLRKILKVLIFIIASVSANAQSRYFVDGYHGGIYGHYPFWVTGFINENLKSKPNWRIGLEIEPETWDSVRVKTPADYAEFKENLTAGKMEFTNPTYAQPYCYNILGESIIRQFGYGIDKIKNHFPFVSFNTYSVEEPCFTSCLPMILKQFGFKYASLKCPDTCWGGYTRGIGNGWVNMIGSDGSVIKTIPRYECESLEENSTWQTIAWQNSEKYWCKCFKSNIDNPVGMCYQDAGWKNGPWLGKKSGKTEYVLWTDYIEKMAKPSDEVDYHISQEDVLVNLMWGSEVLNKIATQVRNAEVDLVKAEKIGAIAFVENGYKFDKTDVDEGWRTLMLSQHHDSWIVPYNGLNKKGTWAANIKVWTDNSINISNNEINNAVKTFERRNADGNEKRILVFNTLSCEREEIVGVNIPEGFKKDRIEIVDSKGKRIDGWTVDNENRISFWAKAPSFGYSVYRLKKVDKGRSIKEKLSKYSTVDGNIIVENDSYKITFDPQRGGTIKSLLMKGDKDREIVDEKSEFLFGEIRGFFYDENCFRSSRESEAKVKVAYNGFDKTIVEIDGRIAGNEFLQTVTLERNSAVIGYDLRIDWKSNPGIGEYKETDWRGDRRSYCDDRFKLSVLFPSDIKNKTIYKDAPFDVCESSLKDTFFDSWSKIKNNVILNWVDSYSKDDSVGLSIFSNRTTSYLSGENFPLGLTIQYSGVGLWGRNYNITEDTNVRFAILPHKDKWDSARLQNINNVWREPLTVAVVDGCNAVGDKALINVSNEKIQISAAYQYGDKLLVRFYNSGSDNTQNSIDEVVGFSFPIEKIEETDLNMNVINDCEFIQEKSVVKMRLRLNNFEVKTFLVTLKR